MAVPVIREKAVEFSNKYIHGHSSRSPNHPLYKGRDKWVLQEQGKHFCQCADCRKLGDCQETMIKILRDHHSQGIPKLKAGHYKPSDYRKGMKDSEEVKQKRSASQRRFYLEDETPEAKQERVERARKVTASMFNQFDRRPTGPEVLMIALLPENVRYVGDGSFYVWIPSLNRNRNPDFKVNAEKKVIELFGDYWHRGEDTAKIVSQYREAGLECLVVWESELMDDPMLVHQKCSEFIGRGERTHLVTRGD